MRKRKHTVLVITLVAAIVLMGGWAFAHGSWGKRGYGPGCGDYSNLTPEQREKLQAQHEKFYQDTAELRRDLDQKRLELQRLWTDTEFDSEKVKAKQKEIFEVQRQLQEKALENRLATREILPQEEPGWGPWGHGHGPGHMGYGHGYGMGHMGYGQGPHHWEGHHMGGPGFGAGRE